MPPPTTASPASNDLVQVGWREWVALPELGIPGIKAKIDTGARTSCLHAFQLEEYEENGVGMVRFSIHPLQHNQEQVIDCTAPVIDHRTVTDSGGHSDVRVVISSLLEIPGASWPIEITLTGREDMKFRMLLGRTAMRRRIMVDPGGSYLLGKQFKPARR